MSEYAKLEVVFQSGLKMVYPNPVSHTCFSIGECNEWHPAKVLSWRALPANSYAMFFENANCYTGEGFFAFMTDKGDANGVKTFENPQPIRSMMVGVDKDAMSSLKVSSGDIARGCWTNNLIQSGILHKTPVSHLAENDAVGANTSVSSTNSEADNTVIAGGLSTNWSEALSASSATA